jgi:hypothetical protein
MALMSDPMISIGAMIGNRQRIERLRERSVFPPWAIRAIRDGLAWPNICARRSERVP